MSSGLISFEVHSVERSNLGSDLSVFKAVDGSSCIFTVSKCNDADSRLELCPICSLLANDQQPFCSSPALPVTEGTQYQLSLGQAPDLAPSTLICGPDQKKHSSFRSLLEYALLGSVLQDLVTVQYHKKEKPANAGSTVVYSVSLRLDRIEYPPQCGSHNTLPNTRWSDEETSAFTRDKKDPLENPTNDWNPELATHWSQRAWALKERGTWIVQRHVNRQTLAADSVGQVWSAAFACYSRALQLATLARSARERCASEAHLEGTDINRETIQRPVGHLNADQLPDCVNVKFDPSTTAITRLEFNLLLNLALCQLKAGCAEFAGDNCSKALTLEPGWVEAVSDQTKQATRVSRLTRDSPVISNVDVAKALYRRAQAYLRVGKAEEAKLDAECACRLYTLTVSNGDGVDEGQRRDNAGAITASEALIAQAVQRLSHDKNILVERIRKRRNQL